MNKNAPDLSAISSLRRPVSVTVRREKRNEIIEPIIDALRKNQAIVEKYNLNSSISYEQTHKSIRRNYERSRSLFMIFLRGIPILSIKFYNDKKSNTLLEREFYLQKAILEKYKTLSIPTPVELLEINGLKVMVEEAFDGKTMYQCLQEDRAAQNLCHMIKQANKLQIHLNEGLTPSDYQHFESEILELTSQFIDLYKPTASEASLIMKLITLLTNEFKNKNIYKRYTNGDFAASNILLDVKNEPILLDFEHAKETHMYFLEWFQFLNSLPQWFEMTNLAVDSCDPILHSALSFFNEHAISNDPVVKAYWLLCLMHTLVTFSPVLTKHEFKKMRCGVKFDLINLFTRSSTKRSELVRLASVSLFIVKTYGIKELFDAFVEKIRVNWFSSR